MTLTPDSISTVEHRENAQEIYAEMILKGKVICFHVDCGVTVNVIPAKYVRHEEINPAKKVSQMWNKSELKPEGVTGHDSKSEEQEIFRGVCRCKGRVNPTSRNKSQPTHGTPRNTPGKFFAGSRHQTAELPSRQVED